MEDLLLVIFFSSLFFLIIQVIDPNERKRADDRWNEYQKKKNSPRRRGRGLSPNSIYGRYKRMKNGDTTWWKRVRR